MFTTSKHTAIKENQAFDLNRKPVESKSAFASQQKICKNTPFDFNLIPLQAKLKINTPGDRYEQEADRIADKVVEMKEVGGIETGGNSQIQRKTLSEEITGVGGIANQRKCSKCGEEEEKVQRKSKNTQPTTTTSAFNSQLNATKGRGNSMDQSTHQYMSSRFGVDFSLVNIHSDYMAVTMSESINAKAFTSGNDIYFNKGEYNPGTFKGKRLLAHELVHTVQQDNSADLISRVPNPNPPPDPFIEGRPAHNHPALGNWSAVQTNAQTVCRGEMGSVGMPGGLPSIPTPPTSIVGKSECACAIMTPMQVLYAARTIEMNGKPLAIAHLNHYISGGGTDFIENANLDNMLNNDAGARAVLASAIAVSDRDNVFIQQGDYSDQNFRLAFGGIDRVDYQVNRAAGTVDVWFKDRYDFHPAGFGHVNMGVGDSAPPGRPTNCVHLAAVEAKTSGASDYWMLGHATVPLALFTSTSTPPKGDDL